MLELHATNAILTRIVLRGWNKIDDLDLKSNVTVWRGRAGFSNLVSSCLRLAEKLTSIISYVCSPGGAACTCWRSDPW